MQLTFPLWSKERVQLGSSVPDAVDAVVLVVGEQQVTAGGLSHVHGAAPSLAASGGTSGKPALGEGGVGAGALNGGCGVAIHADKLNAVANGDNPVPAAVLGDEGAEPVLGGEHAASVKDVAKGGDVGPQDLGGSDIGVAVAGGVVGGVNQILLIAVRESVMQAVPLNPVELVTRAVVAPFTAARIKKRERKKLFCLGWVGLGWGVRQHCELEEGSQLSRPFSVNQSSPVTGCQVKPTEFLIP